MPKTLQKRAFSKFIGETTTLSFKTECTRTPLPNRKSFVCKRKEIKQYANSNEKSLQYQDTGILDHMRIDL